VDQVLPSLIKICAAVRVFSLAAGQGCHRFSPADPADPDGVCIGADLPHLMRLGFVNEQLEQGTGVTEEAHQLNPDPQSRCHS
jgi:hypothetical protein